MQHILFWKSKIHTERLLPLQCDKTITAPTQIKVVHLV